MSSHIVIIDGLNFLHRARSGWNEGPAPVIFNSFRNLRSLVETLKPTYVYFVLEGRPQQRIDACPEYKANRVIEEGTPEHDSAVTFFEQVDIVVDYLKRFFPVNVVRHPNFECDDTIYNIVKRGSRDIDYTVVSNDSDFTQLLNEFANVAIYNPMKKVYVETPDFNYVSWKALRGDGSDNIKGIPGIGDKRALALVNNPEALEKLFSDPVKAAIFERNANLIKFIDWTDEDASKMTSTTPVQNWDEVNQLFQKHAFNSLLKENTWKKFVNTFSHLWS